MLLQLILKFKLKILLYLYLFLALLYFAVLSNEIEYDFRDHNKYSPKILNISGEAILFPVFMWINHAYQRDSNIFRKIFLFEYDGYTILYNKKQNETIITILEQGNLIATATYKSNDREIDECIYSDEVQCEDRDLVFIQEIETAIYEGRISPMGYKYAYRLIEKFYCHNIQLDLPYSTPKRANYLAG